MSDPRESLQSRLAALTPEARARVEEALRTTIDAELAAEAGGLRPDALFSRGVFFSRVATEELVPREQELINQALAMDNEKFQQFAERLVRLKSIKASS